jgi:plastocyanin
MRRATALCLGAVLAFAAASCGGDERGTITIGGESANDHGSEDVSAESSIEFELDDFYFEPTVLQGEAGQTITLEALNEGDEAHTFTSDELGVDEELEPGAEASIEITFPESGQVVFECRFHAGQGMRGAVEVAAS